MVEQSANGQRDSRTARLAQSRMIQPWRRRRLLSLQYFEQLTLVLASLVFTTVALFVTPSLQHNPLLRVVAVVVGGVSLGALFLVLRWVVTYHTIKPLLGAWVYAAYLQGKKVPYLYGSAFFSMSLSTTLSLQTRLYNEREDALQAALGDPEPDSVGALHSRAFSFDSGNLWVLYELVYDDPPETRQGQLLLRAEEGRRTMLRGRWLSSRHGEALRTGRIVMQRPEVVRAEDTAAETAPEVPSPAPS